MKLMVWTGMFALGIASWIAVYYAGKFAIQLVSMLIS
jgi:hypothetical protein